VQGGELRLVDARNRALDRRLVAALEGRNAARVVGRRAVGADEPCAALDALIESGDALGLGEVEIAELDRDVRLARSGSIGMRGQCKTAHETGKRQRNHRPFNQRVHLSSPVFLVFHPPEPLMRSVGPGGKISLRA
jgi:hypothetical protein